MYKKIQFFFKYFYIAFHILDPDCYELVSRKGIYPSTTITTTAKDTTAATNDIIYAFISTSTIFVVLIITVAAVVICKGKFIINILLESLSLVIAFNGYTSSIVLQRSYIHLLPF